MSGAVEFWSSTECGAFQNALLAELTKLGWNAGQRYSVGQADYRHARSTTARLALRLRAYGLYPARLTTRFARAEPGVVGVVCTNTFYAPWLAVKAARGRVPIVHWVFDLFPDALVETGQLARGGRSERSLRGVMRATFDGAAANVFLGERLRQAAEARFGAIPRAHVIAVGADGTPFRDRRPEARTGGGPTTVLYSGNFGRLHDVDTVVGALAAGVPDGLKVRFCGNGAGYRALRNALPGAGATSAGAIEFGENLPDEEWARAMRAAEVALVTMRPGAEALIMPSKTYSAMMAGQAVLAVCPAESDLAEVVRKHDAGWVVAPGDVAGLRAVLARIAGTPDEVMAKRQNSWAAGHRYYDQSVLAPQWAAVLRGSGRGGSTPAAV